MSLSSHGLRTLIVLFFGQWLASPAENARILALETIAGRSHWNFMSAVLRPLTDAGHEVTVFTPFPEGDRGNYTEVDTSKEFPLRTELDIIELMKNFSGPTRFINIYTSISRTYCDKIYENKQLVEIMTDRRKHQFDLIMMEPFTIDCTSYLANTLNAPIIFIIPSPMIMLKEFYSLGHMPNPAYVSHILADYAVPKTFVQRFTNVAQLLYSYFIMSYYQETKLKIFDPKSYDLARTVHPSLIFINTHHITEASRPVSPNVIGIGGIHLKTPKNITKVSNVYCID